MKTATFDSRMHGSKYLHDCETILCTARRLLGKGDIYKVFGLIKILTARYLVRPANMDRFRVAPLAASSKFTPKSFGHEFMLNGFLLMNSY